MGFRELTEKYGSRKTRLVINRAIRAEIPGGGAVLDALEICATMAQANGGQWREAARILGEARGEMESWVRREYGMGE